MSQPVPATRPDLPAPVLPQWIAHLSASQSPGQSAETAGFASGAALALLHVTLGDPVRQPPMDLFRARLALRAAAQCLRLQGRNHTEAEIRDACLLVQAGDAMGPAGDMLAFWKQGVSLPVQHSTWKDRLGAVLPETIREETAELLAGMDMDDGQNPVSIAVTVLNRLVTRFPRQEAATLLVTDAVLARQLKWARPIPLMALFIKRQTLRDGMSGGHDDAFMVACHVALSRAAREAVCLAHDLAHRAALLRSLPTKLRARGAADAVALFLREDAIFPTIMLSPRIRGTRTHMSGHAARRFCERLVRLGVARELTGRPTFRMYGL